VTQAPGAVALRMTGVSKSFGAVRALRDVDLEVHAGEVHALVGENGAGKSTLMGIAAGVLAADAGTVEISGTALTRRTPRGAESLGLVVVYQNPALVADLTVLENLRLGTPAPYRPGWRDRSDWATALLDRVRLQVDLQARVAELDPGDRQLLEIARALGQEPSVLILDEPTESLAAAAVDQLMALIRDVTARGTAVVYISHRIAEVRRIADRITALRDGRIAGTALASDVDDDQVVRMIVGRSLSALFPGKNRSPSPSPALVTENLSGPGFRDVSLVVRKGEILGLAGVEGNGQREFIRALAGLEPASGGRAELGGERLRLHSPRRVAASGVRFTPADRLAEGLFTALSARENVVSGSLSAVSRHGFIQPGRERARVAEQMAATSVKASSMDAGVQTLSGGNQQKVMFAKEILAEPRAMLCDEPTRGVDVGARGDIYRLLRRIAGAGHPVVVLSADAAELAGLCDSVAVFSRGRVVSTLAGDEVTENAITGSALRATASGPAGETDARARRMPRFPARSRASALVRRSDSTPAVVLLALALVVALCVNARQPTFLSPLNVPSLLYGVAILAFLALGQQVVLLTGGLDLSVGPTAGLQVVVMSFVLADGRSGPMLAAGLLAGLGLAVAVGVVNGALVAAVGIPAIIATLATYIGLQGAGLLLRPQVGGTINAGVTEALNTKLGAVPVVFIVAVALALAAEIVSRSSRLGFAVRAAGPGRQAAERMGVRVRLTTLAGYALCSVLASFGGLLLAAQVGTGDPSVGTSYTLASVSAVVLGGASILGARGSFAGAFTGAVLLGLVTNATTSLGLDEAWQYWAPGAVILIAAGASARIRSAGPRGRTS
jgi:ABC-type sugar transport system ATPase subunit/ribose/xylose/arabinose/galactoside ABC-type transport system permease subunit